MNSENFFLELPVIEDFIAVSNPDIYRHLPEDWHVVVTDITNSTQMIEQGGYKTVNLIGASSIIAVLNIKKSFSLTVKIIIERLNGSSPQQINKEGGTAECRDDPDRQFRGRRNGAGHSVGRDKKGCPEECRDRQ